MPRRGDEPSDFWSQSFCYGSRPIESPAGKPIHIRFRNNGGKPYFRAEAHLIQKTGPLDPVKITFNWTDADGEHQESHVFASKGQWRLATGVGVRTRWVEFKPVDDGKAIR